MEPSLFFARMASHSAVFDATTRYSPTHAYARCLLMDSPVCRHTCEVSLKARPRHRDLVPVASHDGARGCSDAARRNQGGVEVHATLVNEAEQAELWSGLRLTTCSRLVDQGAPAEAAHETNQDSLCLKVVTVAMNR